MNRSTRAASVLSLAILSLASLAAVGDARAEEPPADDGVNVLVLRETGAGSASAAQKYIDDVMASVARLNGFASVHGEYYTSRTRAKKFIDDKKPRYGIISLGAFLAMRKPAKLGVLGRASIRGGGLEQYYLVSKTATDLDGCKGETLASNHAIDEKYVDAVIFGGQMSVSEFTLEKTRRPVQTLRAALDGKAKCALIDDAQMADLGNIDGGEELIPVWFSAKLTPMVVVSFADAPAAEAKAFSANLPKVCDGEGKKACDRAGLRALESIGQDALKDVIKAYDG